MVFFNDPLPLADHERQATRLALAAQEQFQELAEEWQKRGTQLGLGIGIEAGYATLGRIGVEGYDYGAVGPVANLASRLSTRAAAGQILIGPRIFAAVEETVETAPRGRPRSPRLRSRDSGTRGSRAAIDAAASSRSIRRTVPDEVKPSSWARRSTRGESRKWCNEASAIASFSASAAASVVAGFEPVD